MTPAAGSDWTAWTDRIEDAGYRTGAVLGSGMEGTVVALDDGLVAKVWHTRGMAELAVLGRFYDAVGRSGMALATPLIHQVLDLDGRCATVESRLSGRPLGSGEVTPATAACVTEVLAALAGVTVTPAMAVLPVLEGEAPFDPAETFATSLAALVVRRVERSRAPLAARLPDVHRIAAAVTTALRGLPPAAPGLVHGDLIPANILVDDDLRPLAVLDFGFLSTVGDPAFDAAVTSSIHDMYGPRARERETALDHAIADRFGHDARRLDVHRAAYALVTATCFSASGSDGHFEWCARMLERRSVREAVGL